MAAAAVSTVAAAGIADAGKMEYWSGDALPVQRQLIGNIQQPTLNIESAEPQPNSMLDVGRSMLDACSREAEFDVSLCP
jgi:hypothetical protein